MLKLFSKNLSENLSLADKTEIITTDDVTSSFIQLLNSKHNIKLIKVDINLMNNISKNQIVNYFGQLKSFYDLQGNTISLDDAVNKGKIFASQ